MLVPVLVFPQNKTVHVHMHDFLVITLCKVSLFRIPWMQNFDLSTELPDVAQEIMKKPTFHGIVEIFHFLSMEFPLLEHRISIFWAQNSGQSV